MKYLLYLVLFLLPTSFILAEDAEIVRIVDGDTVIVQTNNTEEKVRIIGINTPESVDPRRPVECFGKEASAHAAALLDEKMVTLENNSDRDQYGRMLSYIKLSNGKDFGKQMIIDGYAYAYRTYSHERITEYVNAEKQARKSELGLWAPEACLDSTEVQSKLSQERFEYLKDILKILKEIIDLLF